MCVQYFSIMLIVMMHEMIVLPNERALAAAGNAASNKWRASATVAATHVARGRRAVLKWLGRNFIL